MEYILKVALTVLVLIVVLLAVRWVVGVWMTPIDSSATIAKMLQSLNPFAGKVVARDPESIYQNGEVVGRVVGEVRTDKEAVVFAYVVDSRDLNRQLPFIYQGKSYEQLSVELVATTAVTSHGTLHDVLKNVRCRLVE